VAQPGNGNALRHGARSETVVRRSSLNQKRVLLRRLRLRQSDLDAVGLGYVDLWSRLMAKVELYDAWSEEHGHLTPEGKTPGFMREYIACVNGARLALAKLSDHLADRPRQDRLAEFIRERFYSDGEDDDG
jgi:hypothetical protein